MKITIMVAAVFLMFAMGCSTSRITHSWKTESIPEKNYNKIMVVGLILNNDRNLREKMENHLVGDLSERGYTAVSSLKEYGPKSFENMKEQEVINKLNSSGVDAVITVVLLDKQRERDYIPGRIYYSPYTIYHRRFPGYYNTLYDRIYSPGYYQINTKYFWESNFYNIKNNELLYSVQTESFDPNSAEGLAHEYGKLIVNNMASQGIIK
jgi:hypothetical protein